MLTTVMFLVSFAWSFVYVELPFYIEHITKLDAAATLAWTGWILGITSLVSVVATPMWGRYGARHDARVTLIRMQGLQALAFLGLAAADSLPALFLVRLTLGAIGASSTLVFMLAGRVADLAERRRRLAAIQSANTLGTVVGPLAGAVAASRLGFRASFVLGALLLAGCAALVRWRVAPAAADGPAGVARRHRLPLRAVVLASVVVVVGASQEAFLAAVLLRVLPDLGVQPGAVLEAGGVLLFVSGAAAALGGLAAPRLVEEIPQRRLLPLLVGASSVGLIAFGAAGSVWLYTALRIVQALCIAPLFPLMVVWMGRLGGGEAIGIMNAARAGGNFLGPVVATSVLAWGSPPLVYLLLGLIGLAAVPLARR